MDTSSAVLCISIGQAGVQTSNATWELFCLEHGIRPDGSMNDSIANPGTEDLTGIDVFFFEATSGARVARSVIIDLECTVVDEVRTGIYRKLHHPNSLISGFEDAASNFARGRFTVGKLFTADAVEEISRQVERCDRFQGFIIMNSSGGGTGSGFTTIVTEKLTELYGKNSKIMINVYPGETMSTSVVEPYNVALSTKGIINDTDVSILLDNEACYNVCKNNLNFTKPTYNHINRIMSQIHSAVTCTLRFPGCLNSDLSQIQTNLVPYPRIHFPISCYAPLMSMDCECHESVSEKVLLQSIFSNQNRLTSCDLEKGIYMACSLLFRGPVSPCTVNQSIISLKRQQSIEFVDWCPTGFKVSINSQPVMTSPGSFLAPSDKGLTLLANSTALTSVFETLENKFNALFQKRAFVHWFVGEGMEEGELNEALDELRTLTKDYKQCGEKTDTGEDANTDTVNTGEREGTSPANQSTPTEEEEKQQVAEEAQATPTDDEDDNFGVRNIRNDYDGSENNPDAVVIEGEGEEEHEEEEIDEDEVEAEPQDGAPAENAENSNVYNNNHHEKINFKYSQTSYKFSK